MKVLVSAAGSPAAISYLKHLKNSGFDVVGIDSNEASLDIMSAYCDKCFLAPMAFDTEYGAFLTSIASEFDVFLPFIDEELMRFARNEIDISVKHKTILSSDQTLLKCLNKKDFQVLCDHLDLPVIKLTSEVPAVYKPLTGRGSKGVQIIHDQELLDYYRKKAGVIQKYIEGQEYTVDVLVSAEGEWLSGVARKRVNAAGVSTIGQIDMNPDVLELAKLCVEKIAFRYCINIQIMVDGQGKPHLIEINPRLAGSSIFSVMAGFDIVKNTIQLFSGQDVELTDQEKIKPLKVIRHWEEYVC